MSLSFLGVCVVTPILKMSTVKVLGNSKYKYSWREVHSCWLCWEQMFSNETPNQLLILVQCFRKWETTGKGKMGLQHETAHTMNCLAWRKDIKCSLSGSSQQSHTASHCNKFSSHSQPAFELPPLLLCSHPKHFFQHFKRANKWQDVD